MKRIFITLSLFLYFVLPSSACRCQDVKLLENYKSADVVFAGKVLSKITTSNFDSLKIVTKGKISNSNKILLNFPIAVVKIEVSRLYKGKNNSEILTVLTPASSSSCGFSFQLDENYIVFATNHDELSKQFNVKRFSKNRKVYWTHQCTKTSFWNLSDEKEIIKCK